MPSIRGQIRRGPLRLIVSEQRQSDAERGIGSDPTLSAEEGVGGNETLNVEAKVGGERRVIN
jgi:hypothetical protein